VATLTQDFSEPLYDGFNHFVTVLRLPLFILPSLEVDDKLLGADPETLGDTKDILILICKLELVVLSTECLNHIGVNLNNSLLGREPAARRDVERKSYTFK